MATIYCVCLKITTNILFNSLDSRVDDLGGEIDQVGAISAALAGLHPLDYDGTGSKFQLSAAMGSYDSSQAAAIGAFYHFNRDVMLSLGGATSFEGDKKTAANIGVTFRVGEGASGKPFARYWMHNGYINVDNVKMSKSLGNFFTVREVAEKFGYEPIKFMMLQAHYRSPINYTLEVIGQCQASLKRIYNCKDKLTLTLEKAPAGAMTPQQKETIDGFQRQFIAAMDDDFNTADAVSAIFELVRQINTDCDRNPLLGKDYFLYAQKLLDTLLDVMGIVIPRQQDQQLPSQVQELVNRRAQARKEKNFALADQLRDEIAALGYEVKETRQGTQITKK